MNYTKRRARILGKLLLTSAFGLSFVVVRSAMRTPQPLKSVLPGEEHIYKWTQGHIFYKVFGAEDAPPLVLVHLRPSWWMIDLVGGFEISRPQWFAIPTSWNATPAG